MPSFGGNGETISLTMDEFPSSPVLVYHFEIPCPAPVRPVIGQLAMKHLSVVFLSACLLLLSHSGVAAQEHQHGSGMGGGSSNGVGGVGSNSRSDCADLSLSCATSATPAFGPDGRLWLAWSAGGRISVAHSSDQGRSFSTPVAVNRQVDRIDEGADSRPQIVVAANGTITVLYDLFHGRFVGQVLASRSTDNGASFSPPQPVSDNSASQRFQSLALDASGDLFAFWIDRREEIAAKKEGREYPGGALAFSTSHDGGGTSARRA